MAAETPLPPTPPELTLPEILAHFATDDAARLYLEAVRWQHGRFCPHCGNADETKIHAITPNRAKKVRPGLYDCGACRQQFTVTVRTIFHGAKKGLLLWLAAFYLLCSSKKGPVRTSASADAEDRLVPDRMADVPQDSLRDEGLHRR